MKNKRKNSEDMTYLLICFGDFKNKGSVIQKIADSIMPAVSSQNVKYYNNDLNIIYHFQSPHKFEDLKVFVDTGVTDFVGMYFLISCNNSVSLGMPNEIYDYLFDLTSDAPAPDMNKFMVDNGPETDDLSEISAKLEEMMNMDELFEDDNDELARILRKSRKKEEQPSLDYLLDKISESGVGSLTKKEKELLDMYSSK